ncbi:hypothetical protein BG22_09190 [Bifidobacterium sp. UTBIF-78]|nr:hypothetical protein BG22_09190 [Bifidobacterium sp. UTBIF-78]
MLFRSLITCNTTVPLNEGVKVWVVVPFLFGEPPQTLAPLFEGSWPPRMRTEGSAAASDME